jgi:hypothetical protein
MTPQFGKDSRLSCLLVGISLFTLLVSAVCGTFSNQFISSVFVKTYSHIPTVVCVSLILLWFRSSRFNHQIIFVGRFKQIKKLSFNLMWVALIYGIVWISFAISIPRVGNFLVGETTSFNDVVTKRKSKPRTPCKYQLDIKSMSDFNFDYCISEDEFNRLLPHPYKAQLTVRSSFFGVYVVSVDVGSL